MSDEWNTTDYWPPIEMQGEISSMGCSCDESQDAYCTVHGDPVIMLGTITRIAAALRDAETKSERLARWKAEALGVLRGWDEVWESLGEPFALGQTLSASCITAITELRALRDAIPGDDKLATVQWAVTIAAEELLLRDACPNHDEGFTTAVLTCPSSVRAALRSNEVQS